MFYKLKNMEDYIKIINTISDKLTPLVEKGVTISTEYISNFTSRYSQLNFTYAIIYSVVAIAIIFVIIILARKIALIQKESDFFDNGWAIAISFALPILVLTLFLVFGGIIGSLKCGYMPEICILNDLRGK